MAAGLTFFCELGTAPLQALVAQPGLVPALAAARCRVALALLDLAPERAAAVQLLETAGVPVTAWLVLPEADGYWLTADNAALATARYHAVAAWAQRHGLQLDTVGLDIEPPHADAVGLAFAPLRTLAGLWRRRRAHAQVQQAREAYGRLVAAIRADGRRVETYQFPFVVDERRAGSRLLQRALGVVDLRADREVLMLYRSALAAPWGGLLVDAYGPDAEAIAVGVTGGGVPSLQPAFEGRLLDLPELLTELGRARRYGPHLYVFSLEGCVEHGLLEGLLGAELAPVRPAALRPVGRALRAGLRAVLRLGGC